MKIAIKKPEGGWEYRAEELSTAEIIRSVEGPATVYYLDNGLSLIVNESAESMGLPYNMTRAQRGGIPFGSFSGTIVAARMVKGDFVPLTDSDINYLNKSERRNYFNEDEIYD